MTAPTSFSSPENRQTELRIKKMAFSTHYAIATQPPSTPLTTRARTGHSTPTDLTQFLPAESDISTLQTPQEAFKAIKDHLSQALAGSSKNLFKSNVAEPSFRDITTATAQATKALETPIEKTAASLLQAVHELLLRRAGRPAWRDATFLEENLVHDTDATQSTTKNIDILKNFTQVPKEDMKQVAIKLWSDPDSHPKSMDGMSHFYVRKTFAQLLLDSLSPEFKVIIQTKVRGDLLMDGPLVWLTIAQSIFASGAVLKRELKNNMIALTVPGSNDNYETYLQSLRSALVMLPDVDDTQVFETFLQEMEGHPATTVKNTFAAYRVEYYEKGKLPLPFAELVDKAERLVSICASTGTAVPRKSPQKAPSDIPKTKTIGATPADDILTLLAERVDSQQDTMKKMLGMLSSLENSQKQFKANFAKNKSQNNGNSTPGYGGTNRTPPFMNDAPSDPIEVKQFNGKPWYWCAKCKNGAGTWSPTHSTNGVESINVDPHRGGSAKRVQYDASASNKKAKVASSGTTANRSDLQVMKASLVASGRTMSEILAARNAQNNDSEQN
jgi:hypothetical protein